MMRCRMPWPSLVSSHSLRGAEMTGSSREAGLTAMLRVSTSPREPCTTGPRSFTYRDPLALSCAKYVLVPTAAMAGSSAGSIARRATLLTGGSSCAFALTRHFKPCTQLRDTRTAYLHQMDAQSKASRAANYFYGGLVAPHTRCIHAHREL